MRATGILAVLAATTAIAATTATATPWACGPKQMGGATVRTWCGPAQVTVSWAGKTLTVKGGSCAIDTSLGEPYFVLNAGRYTVPPAKPKATAFSAAQGNPAPLKAGSTLSVWLISFQTPGKQYLLRATTAKVKIMTSGGRKATFTGRLDSGGKVTGAWTC